MEKNILFWTNPKPFLMMIPGIIIVAFLATYVFRQYTKVNEDRLEDRRERIKEVRAKYLQQLIQAKTTSAHTEIAGQLKEAIDPLANDTKEPS